MSAEPLGCPVARHIRRRLVHRGPLAAAPVRALGYSLATPARVTGTLTAAEVVTHIVKPRVSRLEEPAQLVEATVLFTEGGEFALSRVEGGP